MYNGEPEDQANYKDGDKHLDGDKALGDYFLQKPPTLRDF